MIIYLAAVLLLLIGLWAVTVKNNLLKVVIGLMLMQYSANLLLIALAHRWGGREWVSQLAALLGLATTIVLIALIRRNHDRSGTVDVSKLTKLKG
jgi:multicomponent Na+:H+ antiporter subunit C